MIITPYSTSSTEGKQQLASLADRFQLADSSCQQNVTDILNDIRTRGDDALLEYTRKFDAPGMTIDQLKVTDDELQSAYGQVDDALMASLTLAKDRIQTFHEREMDDSWILTREDGTITGRLVRPVSSAGLYVPGGQGGKTPLVSSVLMNGIPAGIAGVARRVMVTPPNENGAVNPALLVAAQEIGITEIYKTGSAWAIAALAFGTASIAPVDVIVGPGNQYVTEAKRQVMGRVRIDMIAGPSEVLIVADEYATPAFIAADMLAQAEHDPQALAILLTTSEAVAHETVKELELQLSRLSREDIARKSLIDRGVILITHDVDEAIDLANDIAIEHLELMLTEPFEWLPKINHAGAIFLGNYSPEACGDYVAGPNHVLPTMGTARISSALGVETFLKKSSLISYSRQAFLNDAGHIQNLANLEGLTAHARSVTERLKLIEN
ncbi:MAG: histidinol dehydrogenase [Desulfobulbaceae bacterium]|uniref:Histidinol dehydrogenase n=1 Tax=Candidatus Desulfobia pelagia TaxID=2841692 RepID=A0A8J6NG78_9BACT|nr:histidinol dehydrogenase [Candidatus Desulfobia pelagia]